MTASARAFAAAALPLAFAACSSNYSAWTPYVSGPALVSTGATTITLSGGRFEPGAIAYWNGRALPTTFESTIALEARLDPSATLVRGLAEMTVANPQSDMAVALDVQIVDAPLALTSIDPATVPIGAGDLTLTVQGTGFMPGSKVIWDGAPVETRFSSSTLLTAAIGAGLLATPGSGSVYVRNPDWRGQACNPPFAPCDSNRLLHHVGEHQLVVADVRANDLAWDAVHGVLYAAIPPEAPARPNTIASMDAATGTILASVPAEDPLVISVADDGSYVYVGTRSTPGRVTRYGPEFSAPVSWPVSFLSDLQVAPGAAGTIAISTLFGVEIWDDGVKRPNASDLDVELLAWGSDASLLFGVRFGFYAFQVDASGAVLATQTAFDARVARIHHDALTHLIYLDDGRVLDEEGRPAASFPLVGGCVMVPDSAQGRAFFACLETEGEGLTVRSFDLATRQPLGTYVLDVTAQFVPYRLVRWGVDGLALATYAGKIYLLRGPFVR